MMEPKPTDDELVAAEKCEYVSRWKALLVVVPISMCTGIGAGWAAMHGKMPAFLIDKPLLWASAFALLITPIAYWIFRRNKAPKEVRSPRIQRRLIETHQKRENLAAVVDIFLLPIQAFLLVTFRTGQHGWGTDLNGWIFPACFTITVAASLLGLYRGQSAAAEDEWLHATRGAAIRLAFLIAAVGICVSTVLTQIDPVWGASAAPISLAAAIAVARIRFLILVARADKGDEA